MKPLLLAAAAGIALAVSLPPVSLEGLGWVALAPLLIAVRGRSLLEAIGLSLLCGVIAGAVNVGWAADWEALYSAYVPFFWLALLLSVIAAAASLARRSSEGMGWIAFTASAAVTAEWATHLLPLPMNLALTQHRNPAALSLAGVGGIW